MRSLTSLSLPLILSILLGVVVAEQKCYGLNGEALDDTYGPCNPDAQHSGCCAIHRPAGSTDICLDNGLCMATNGEFMGTVWQDGCTDPTGQDAGCPKMCPDARDNFGGLKAVLAWNVQMCDYGSYCCREVNDRNNCCNNATAPKITTDALGAFNFETSTAGASATTSSSSEPTVVVGTAFTTAIPAPSATAAQSTATPTLAEDVCRDEKKKTAAVGGAIGGIAALAIAALLGVMLWMYKKEKRQRRLKEHYESQFEKTWAYRSQPQTIIVEADSDYGSPVEKEAQVIVQDDSAGSEQSQHKP